MALWLTSPVSFLLASLVMIIAFAIYRASIAKQAVVTARGSLGANIPTKPAPRWPT